MKSTTLSPVSNHKIILELIKQNPRYLKNIQYGAPRRGHAEGTVEKHITELEDNLNWLMGRCLELAYVVGPSTYWQLKLLIHVHDSFKEESKRNAAIEDPLSHASLAADFLSSYVAEVELVNITQYHDLGYAVYRKFLDKKIVDDSRIIRGLDCITNLNLYLLFCIVDSCTQSKGREMIHWWVKKVNELYGSRVRITEDFIRPGPMKVGDAW